MDSTWSSLAAIGLLFVAVSFLLPHLTHTTRFLNAHPWVGKDGAGWFASYKARLASLTKTRTLLLDGYEKFSKHNKLFVLPQLSTPPIVVLPTALVHEFLSKGDDQIDHRTLGAETLASSWTIGNDFLGDSHFDVVRRQLTRKLPLLTSDVYSELVLAMQQQWPVSADDWTTVKVYPTCMKIVSRAANRVFSGAELCRSADYLEHSRLYAQSVFKSGGLLKLVPKVLHPIVAPLIVRPMNKHRAICMALSIPVIQERQRQMAELGENYEAPTDVLQWILDDTLTAPESMANKKSPEWISRFLLLLNMVAIHTTSIVISNTLMDIYTSPDKEDVIAGLREEVERVVGNGEWSKNAINGLLRVDSCIRETMRVQGLGDLGPRRLISNPDGIDLSGGVHIPHGVRVSIPAHAIHRDDTFYTNANQWDGFRFSRPREEFQKQAHMEPSERRLEKILDLKNQALVTTTDEFFSFGFGKHACPGRFFASQEMKLMLAHIVTTYDVEINGSRPDNFLINGASVPRDGVEMRLRLRATK